MSSTIKVDNIQNQCGANIINESSNTITIGASGDTVTLASGASQSGFGRSGTVDWQTGDIKTANFTATSGEGYFCNTTSGSFTVTLPSGSAGAIVSVQDYANTFDTNALTISPASGEKINGGVGPASLATQGQGVTLVYIDSTQGWRSVQDNVFDGVGSNYVTATGGTIATCGDFKIHTFTGPGTFTVTSGGSPAGSNTVDYLVVAGGAGGGDNPGQGGGGGGAGGFRYSASTYTSPSCAPGHPLRSPTGLPVTAQAYPITVGSGGSGGSGRGSNGSNSIFSTITSAGGGGGGVGAPTPTIAGAPGGSGGGGGGRGYPDPNPGGSGNTPPVSPPQGNDGGNGRPAPGGPSNDRGGGGGGATAAGTNAGNDPGTAGAGGAGAGLPSAFGTSGQNCGSFYYFSGGGGGGKDGGTPTGCTPGGLGGGGKGGKNCSSANAGTANTGGGGGGNGTLQPGSANGGSGIVIIRYKFQN